jgi:hypothetical protein
MEKELDPGKRWKRGFFSMGSTFAEIARPKTRVYSFPPWFSLTPQMPRFEGEMVHRWLQR